jgi:hypothetical protein
MNVNALQQYHVFCRIYFFTICIAFFCVAVLPTEKTFAQGYDTGGTLDDPDRRVLLNNASNRKKTITQIVYIVDDGSPNGVRFIYQNDPSTDNPGGGGPPTSFMTTNSIGASDEVRIHRIRVDTTGTGGIADIFPIDKIPSSVSNFAPNLVNNSIPSQNGTIVLTGTAFPVGASAGGAQQYDAGTGGPPTNEYISDLTNVVSITDMRSYWDLAGGALGSAGQGFPGDGTSPQRYVDIMYDDLFCCFDFIAISERWGNTPMAVAALDQNGNILRRNSPGSSLTGTDKSFRVDLTEYQWNTGIQNQLGDVNGGQPQWISVFQIRQFYGGGLDGIEGTAGQSGPGGTGSIVNLSAEPPIPVYGYRIYMLSNDGGDGKVLGFESPRIVFTEDECWRTLSSPFQGLTYAEVLNDIWTQGSLNSNYPSGDPNVYFFDINTNDYEPVADLDTVIPAGQGFLVSVFQDDEFGVPGSFDKALNRVRGREHGDNAPATVTPTLNTTANGWTLLGNPYATSIDFDLITKANLTNVAYVYDNTNSNWVSSSPISGIGDFNGLISPFQGFFVQTASSGTPSVTFNDDAKVPKQSATFFGKEHGYSEAHYVRLQLVGEELTTSTWIVFDEFGNAEGHAFGDALQLTPYADDFAILATRKLDDTLMDIGVYPHPLHFSGHIEVPLYVETTKSGRFTLTATDLNLPFTMDGLVLYDRERDVEIPISDKMEYQFELNRANKSNLTGGNYQLSCNLAGNDLAMAGSPNKAVVSHLGTSRFVIRLADGQGANNEIPAYIRLNQNYPNPFNPATQIQFELPQQREVRLEVYDMTGRQIASLLNETVDAGIHTVNFDAANLSSGVYIYRLQAGNVVLTRKLTLIK